MWCVRHVSNVRCLCFRWHLLQFLKLTFEGQHVSMNSLPVVCLQQLNSHASQCQLLNQPCNLCWMLSVKLVSSSCFDNSSVLLISFRCQAYLWCRHSVAMRLADLKNDVLVGCSDEKLLAECKQVLSMMVVTNSSACLLYTSPSPRDS